MEDNETVDLQIIFKGQDSSPELFYKSKYVGCLFRNKI